MNNPKLALQLENSAGLHFPDPQSRSAQLFARACAVLPGGNTRHSVYFPPYPIYAVRGQGCRVWDADGVERIDMMNNYSSLIHGHSHPAVVQAIAQQGSDDRELGPGLRQR